MADTFFNCSVVVNGSDIEGLTSVKLGGVTVNSVSVPNLATRLVSKIPGSLTFDPYTFTVQHLGENYVTLATIAVASNVVAFIFRKGATDEEEEFVATFNGFITNITPAGGDNDTLHTFEVTVQPTTTVSYSTDDSTQ